nr:hypothetical protein [uncultured Rhodopila sp.]
MSASVANPFDDPRAPQTTDPIAKFQSDVEARRVSGSAAATVLGWSLYLFVMFDAVMNACGAGSISMLVCGMIISRQGARGPGMTGTAIILSIMQLLVLAAAAYCLAESPWRRWLRTALRDTQPGMPLLRMFLDIRAGEAPSISGGDLLAMLRDFVLFGLGVIILGSVATSDSVSSGVGGFIIIIASVVLSYGFAKITVAVVGRARGDTASAIGLLAGCAVPLLASAYAGSSALVLHTTSGGLAEFSYYQFGVFAICIVGVWLMELGSVDDSELIPLSLAGGRTGIFRDLPDMTAGAFKPFLFQVRASGEKLVLLSRPIAGATSYQVHSTLDRHDPFTAQWSLLNLSELDRSIKDLSITGQGHTRYLEATIKFQLETAAPEQYIRELRDKKIYLPIDDLVKAQSQMFSADNVTRQMSRLLDAVISDHLDQLLQTEPFGICSLTSMTKIRSVMQQQVSELKQALDLQVAVFQAMAATGLRLDRADEVRDHLVRALRDVAPMMGAVRAAYSNASGLDQGIGAARNALQTQLEVRVNDAMRLLSSSAARSGDANFMSIRLTDLIEVTVQSVKVDLTADARLLHEEITSLYKDADSYWSQASAQLGVIAKEHGDVVRKQFEIFFDPRTPGHIRNWGLGQLAGASDPVRSPEQQPPPAIQTTQNSESGIGSNQSESGAAGRPGPAAASAFQSDSAASPSRQGSPASTQGPFPD